MNELKYQPGPQKNAIIAVTTFTPLIQYLYSVVASGGTNMVYPKPHLSSK